MPKVKKNVGAKPKKMNAAQKIDALENLVVGHGQQIKMLGDEVNKLRNSIVSLSRRLNASIQATDSNDSVKKIIVEENVKELEGKVQFLVDQKILIKSDESVVVDKTFIVGREIDKDSNVVNPRIQFAVGSLPEEMKSKMMGHKVGDVIETGSNELKLEITEAYVIAEPPQPSQKFEGEESKEEVQPEEAPKAPEDSGTEPKE